MKNNFKKGDKVNTIIYHGPNIMLASNLLIEIQRYIKDGVLFHGSNGFEFDIRPTKVDLITTRGEQPIKYQVKVEGKIV